MSFALNIGKNVKPGFLHGPNPGFRFGKWLGSEKLWFITLVYTPIMWAPICVQHWGDDGNFICHTMHFWEYLCDNWSTEWFHFALLNTDVEAFLNQLSY